MATDLPITDIHIGERARTDLGDLTELVTSIKEVGLLQPIVITPDRELVAGGRRLAACTQIGMDRVPVHVAEDITDAVSLLVAERDENTCRKDMTVTEKLAIGARIEELKRPEAAERMAKGGETGRKVQQGLASSSRRGSQNAAEKREQETAALAASAVGLGRASYYAAKSVKRMAEDEQQPPTVREAAQDALAEMDATGTTQAVYRRFRKQLSQKQAPEPAKTKPTPTPAGPTDSRGRRLPQRAQREALTKGIAALSGLCSGLGEVTELDPAINAEEAAQWVRDLSEAQRILRGLNNLLKERTSAQR